MNKFLGAVAAAFLATGAAHAAEGAMECCKKCECCRDRKGGQPDDQAGHPAPAPKPAPKPDK